MSVATARAFAFRVVAATILVVAAGAFLSADRAAAQGITTSAVRGQITDEQGQPVAGATVILTGRMTGLRYQGVSQANGRFYLTNIPVGEYVAESRAIGFRPARQGGVELALGQVAEVNLHMQTSTVELAPIVTTVARGLDPMSVDRTGPASLVTDSMVRNLPSLSRDFGDFLATIPQVAGGVGSSSSNSSISAAGTNNRYNNMQIDGSVNNDLFGLAGTGTPGGQANVRPISVEAIREFQVLIAPFDVRQSGFTGALVNAVTRSGSNEFHASVFGFYQGTNFGLLPHIFGWDGSLVGRDSNHVAVTDFEQKQYGIDVSGPIIHDKLSFFLNLEPQSRSAPYTGTYIGSDTTGGRDSIGIGIRYPTVTRVAQIVRDSSAGWGGPAVDPGNELDPTLGTPALNAFGKLTWQPGTNNTVEFSFNHVDGSTDVFSHSPTSASNSTNGGYELSNAGYKQANITNSYRMIWTRPFSSRINNEMILAYQKIADHREVPAAIPLVFVGAERGRSGTTGVTTLPSVNVSFGAERFSQGNSLDQKIIEITDNLTFSLGHGHTLTLGTHNELFQFHNVFFQGSYGTWQFSDTTALKARSPFRYEILVPVQDTGSAVCATNPLICASGATGNGPIADFHVNQLGGYVQDQFQPNSRLNLTFGVRLDVPLMDRPNYNINLDTATITNGPNTGQKFGINTSTSFPAANMLISPRFGFNYDVHGDGNTLLRGGIGIFSGRPPYVWVSNAFVNTGLEQVDLVCDGAFSGAAGTGGLFDSVPTFTTDLANMPVACRGPSNQGSAAASVVYFDKNFHFPQSLRASLGIDRRLPWNMTATVDLMFTQWLNAIYLNDVNLLPTGFEFGEGNRQLYGTIANTTSWVPNRQTRIGNVNTRFNDVLLQSNTNKDYEYQITFQLQKRFSNGMEFNGGYTHGHSYDLMSLTSSISSSNFRGTSLDGTFANRNLRPSAFDVPDRVTFSITGNLPAGFRGTLQYAGRSGTPYAYNVSNDANGDGLSGVNDLVYVPLNAQDIQICPFSPPPPATAVPCTTTSQDAAQYKALDAYINAEPCLQSQRGRIMQRNSCRNPWVSFVNGRLAKTIPTLHGQSIELTADIFNVLSFLGIGGKVTATSPGFETTSLLSFNRYNAAAGRGVYTMTGSLSNLRRVQTLDSRWRILLGARYTI